MCDRHTPPPASVFCVTGIEVKPRTTRKKLWELEQYFHCSIIGTCLTLAELRQIARKARISAPSTLNDYELHVVFVNLVRDSGPTGRLVQKHLDRKYQRVLEQIPKKPSPQDLQAYWNAATAKGNVAGAFWALITHPDTPKALLDQIYGEIHMLSHLAGASIRVDMQTLDQLKRRCAQQENQLAEAQTIARQRLRQQQTVIDLLEQRLAQAVRTERKLLAAEARLTMLEHNPLVTQLAAQVNTLTARLDAAQSRAANAESVVALWEQQAGDAGARAAELEEQLAACVEERTMLEATLVHWLSPAVCDDAEGTAESGYPAPDLVGRCVLYVGGRPSQCAHFRALVERCNGRFLHHDGGREDARAQLWDVVQHADAVLYPLDCISHDAVHRIKRFCARHTKPLVFLPRASLAAFTRGLSTVATGATGQ